MSARIGILLNVDPKKDQIFRIMPKCSNFHGSFHGAFTNHNGTYRIGTSSAGRCMRPNALFLASSVTRPVQRPRSPRDVAMSSLVSVFSFCLFSSDCWACVSWSNFACIAKL